MDAAIHAPSLVSLRGRASAALASLPRRAITRSGGLTMGTGVARLGTLAAAVIVARMLGRADLGRYAAAIAIGAIVVSGPGSGLPIMAIREVAAGRRGRDFVVRAARAELLLTGLATGVAVGIAMAVMGGGADAARLGLLAGVGNMALTQMTLAECVGLGLKRYRLVIALQIAFGLLVPALTFIALQLRLGVQGAVGALTMAGVPCAAIAFWALRHTIQSTPDELDTRRLLWRSRSFLGLSAVNGGYQRIDAVLLLAVAGATATGVYASAYRLLGPFDLLAAGFAQVLFPMLSSVDADATTRADLRRRATRLYCLTVFPLLILALAGMPVVLVAAFGPSFHSAVTPARILLLSVIPSTLYWPDALGIMAAGREAIVLYLFVFSTLVDAALVVGLGSHFGAAGAAWAWVAAELSLWLGLRVVLTRRFRPGLVGDLSGPAPVDQSAER